MADTSGLTLEAIYTAPAATYSYSALELSDALPDESQISAFLQVEQVRIVSSGLITPVNNLPVVDQNSIRLLDGQYFTVDSGAKNITVRKPTASHQPGKIPQMRTRPQQIRHMHVN